MEKPVLSQVLQNPFALPIKIALNIKASLVDWPIWWKNLSFSQKTLPAALVLSYWAAIVAVKGFRTDHLAIGICLLSLSYMGQAGRTFLSFSLPFFLTGIVYDSQRFYAEYIRGPVHVREPYSFDKHFFGISTPSGVLTPNEWWQLHTHPVLDLITGFAYLVFFALFILISGYFLFYKGNIGTLKYKAKEFTSRVKLMPWAFFWLNVVGYSTYYWYAAAPPWYVALYGLGPARMDVAANSAGCARFDQILGTHFFDSMYGRAADVFGAIPSLHVAYPLLAVYFAFYLGAGRIFCVCFYLLMVFSAIYLNHHYVLDILWGSSYALLVGLLTQLYYESQNRVLPKKKSRKA